jgi:hypothetical protein
MISILNTLYSTVVRKGAAFSAAINSLFAILEARSTYFENEKASKTIVKELEDADLLDKASIILSPTGYSVDTIHNVKPGSTPFGDITLIQNGTATRVDENGFVVTNATDIPRIDYSKGEGAILCETSSVNQIRYSEDFSNALWTKAAINLTSSTGTSPRGTSQTLYTIDRAPASGDGLHTALASSATGNGVGMSIWIRRVSGAGSTGNVWIGREPESGGVMFSGNVYAIGSEWQRIEYKSTGYTGTSRMYINPQYGHQFQVWGAQTEKSGGGQPGKVSSYIPTTSLAVTRNRDNYANGGDSTLIGQTEGVLYFEGASLTPWSTGRAIALSDGGAVNRIVLYFDFQANQIRGIAWDGNGAQVLLQKVLWNQTDFNKIAIKYKSGDIALWINGTEEVTSTSALSFTAPLTELAFDQGNGSIHMDGFIKSVVVFKEALSDAELTALTS